LGPSDNAGYTLRDALPAGTTFVSAPGCSFASGEVDCTSSGLAATGMDTFTITVHISAGYADGADLTNSASVAAADNNTSDPDQSNNTGSVTVTVNRQADVSITKSDSPDPVTAGNNLTYTLTASNSGPSNAQGVDVTDTMPTEL